MNLAARSCRFLRPTSGPRVAAAIADRRGATRGFARRDPPLPPLTNPTEQAIDAAQKRGALDNLSGAGKPLTFKHSDTVKARPMAGMSTAELLSKKAEVEMRRAIHNNELDHVAYGQPLEYRGTNIVSSSLSSSNSDQSTGATGATAMGQHILKQAQPSVENLKNLKK
jgi:Domain of unknown function (DUF1992)